MGKLLLDGAKMEAKVFYAEFERIVGCSEKDFCNKKDTVSGGGGDWWEYIGKKFTYGGSAYGAPKLYQNSKKR